MRTRRARPTTAVPIDGTALRRIRIDRGIEVAELARRVQVSRPYISKLELGHSKRVSPTVHKALLQVLQLADRGALRSDRTAV